MPRLLWGPRTSRGWASRTLEIAASRRGAAPRNDRWRGGTFWISDFGFWIEEKKRKTGQDGQDWGRCTGKRFGFCRSGVLARTLGVAASRRDAAPRNDTGRGPHLDFGFWIEDEGRKTGLTGSGEINRMEISTLQITVRTVRVADVGNPPGTRRRLRPGRSLKADTGPCRVPGSRGETPLLPCPRKVGRLLRFACTDRGLRRNMSFSSPVMPRMRPCGNPLVNCAVPDIE